MTEDTWARPRVCPGAEVRPGGSSRWESRVYYLGEAERSCASGAVQLCASVGGHWGQAGVIRTDLLHVLLQEDARMVKREFHLTQKRSGSNGRMTRG